MNDESCAVESQGGFRTLGLLKAGEMLFTVGYLSLEFCIYLK